MCKPSILYAQVVYSINRWGYRISRNSFLISIGINFFTYHYHIMNFSTSWNTQRVPQNIIQSSFANYEAKHFTGNDFWISLQSVFGIWNGSSKGNNIWNKGLFQMWTPILISRLTLSLIFYPKESFRRVLLIVAKIYCPWCLAGIWRYRQIANIW